MICKAIGCARQAVQGDYCLEHAKLLRDYGGPPPKHIRLTTKPKRVCEIDDCNRPYFARGMCNVHYARVRRNGKSSLITYNGETANLKTWAARLGITGTALRNRLNHWPFDLAMTLPKHASNRGKTNVRLIQDHDCIIMAGTEGIILQQNTPRIGECVVEWEVTAIITKDKLEIIR